MSSTSNIPFNDPTIQAIEGAIRDAADDFCAHVTLDQFDPWAGDFSAQSSHQRCYQCFNQEIAVIAHQIPGNLDESDLVAYAGTRGWLYGYSCAQDKALPVISAKDTAISDKNNEIKMLGRELSDSKMNLNKKIKELKKIKKTTYGKLFYGRRRARYGCGILGVIAAVAIAVIIIDQLM